MAVGDKVKVEVRQGHMARGRREGDGPLCPLEVALTEQHPGGHWIVGVHYASHFDDNGDQVGYLMPPEASRFVRAWDAVVPVQPLTCELLEVNWQTELMDA